MDTIIEYLSDELDKIQHERPSELDALRRTDSAFKAWADAGAALGSFSGMLAILWEMAEERKGGARTMAEVAGRYSRHTAERLDQIMGAEKLGAVLLKAADAYDDVKTYRDLSRIIEVHARWVGQLKQWIADELPWTEVSTCVEDAWKGKGKSKGKKARKIERAKLDKAIAKAEKKAKRSEKGKKAKKKPRKGNKGKK